MVKRTPYDEYVRLDLVSRILENEGYTVSREPRIKRGKLHLRPDLIVEEPTTGVQQIVEVRGRADQAGLAQLGLYMSALGLERGILVSTAASVSGDFRALAESVGVEVRDADWVRRHVAEWPESVGDAGDAGAPASLWVERLELEHFKGFEHLDLTFDTSVTVLIGQNGAGKSTILDAIARALSWFYARIEQPRGRGQGVNRDEARDAAGHASIRLTAQIGAHPVTWRLTSPRGKPHYSSLRSPTEALRTRLETSSEATLPVAVYYPVNRSSVDIPRRIRRKHSFDRMDAMQGALIGGNRDFRLFFEWFRLREDLENEKRRDDDAFRDPQLVAVRAALEAMMPGYTDLRIRRSPQRMVLHKQGREIQVDRLSDGERTLLTLVGDLARRLALANPRGDALKGSGVVLIDEVALHLHPAWQRRIIPDLRRVFPGIQFIITTHTPLVLSTLGPASVVILEEFSVVERPPRTAGRDANSILADAMDVQRYPEPTRALLGEIEALTDAGRGDEARSAVERLAHILGEDDEAVVYHRVYLDTLLD